MSTFSNAMHFFTRLFAFFSIVLLFNMGESFAQHVIINEVMASNASFYPDEDGSFEDWIELYNAGDEAVNLEGWGLSDNYGNPFRWTFPDYVMHPGEYLWIWASGKDRKEQPGQMHHGIKRRYYPGITGVSVNDLLNHWSFPDHPAERNVYVNYFEAPADIADYYGQHLFTWVMPPQTGEYVFWIASDDNSRLYLSSDDSPENVSRIAEVPGWTRPREWDKYPQQMSDPVSLEEGQLYYLEALQKEHTGGDNLSVRWQWPNGSIDEPISALHCFIPETRFHTNFSISASGEEILLTDPQGNRVDEMEPVEIPTDVSYGRLPGNLDEWVYFSEPTPGAANTTGAFAGLSPKPVLSPEGGVFRNEAEVRITVDDPEAQIFYTLDGSKPTPDNGELYEEAFTIENTAYVRAVAVSPGSMPSEIAGMTYSVAAQNLRDFSSDIPVMIIHDFNTPITAGFRTRAYMSLYDTEETGRAAFGNEADISSRIKINIRGSSSQAFPKKGFGFHILEEDEGNRKESLLGMAEDHNWVLHGPYSDKSLMRNAYSYALAEDAGHYTPRTRFIELFMHSGNGPLSESNYHGVYVLTERIKIAPGKLELADMEAWHSHYPEVTGGYIFKIDRLNPGEFGLYTQRGSHFVYTRPNEQDISLAQENYLVAYLDSLETALFGDEFTCPQHGYAAYMDVMSFIDMHLITELTKEIDGFRLSTFFYKDRESKIFSGPLWDFNLALGNANYLQGWMPEGWYYPLISNYDYNRGWYTRLFQDQAFADRYDWRYRLLRLTAFSEWNLVGRIQRNMDELQESQERNFERWDVLGSYVWPNWFIADTWQEEMEWMTNWLKQRVEWIDTQLGEPYTMMHYWNFNGMDYMLPTYSLHNASIIVSGSSATEVTTGTGQDFRGLNARNGDETGNHLRVNYPTGAELTFNISSVNYRDLTFSYEARRSGSGANRHYISYTVDGGEFIPMDTLAITEQPRAFNLYFGNIEGVDNNASFAIRISMAYDPDDEGGMAGNNRFDNVTLDGETLTGVARPPLQILPLDDHIELIAQGEALVLDLHDHFKHPDGLPLDFSVDNPPPQKAIVEVVDNQLHVTPIERGGLGFKLEVDDGINSPIKKTFYVLIYPEAHRVNEGDYVFDFWSQHEPEGSFPENILFTQGAQDDAFLDTPIRYAYSIPAWDYASGDQGNIGYPYRNESRTRINGLGAYGISFINTGRERDLGAAVLAIDTRDLEAATLSWEASTFRVNSRVYHIRLQYRTCINKPWRNWLDDEGNAVEYQRGDQVGHIKVFEEMPLPSNILDKEYVQIRWLYYHTGLRLNEDSGARDMLGINNIVVSESEVSVPADEISANKLTAFPNPSKTGMFNLNMYTSGHVFNMQGRLLFVAEDINTLNLAQYPQGLYFFRSLEGESVKLIIGW